MEGEPESIRSLSNDEITKAIHRCLLNINSAIQVKAITSNVKLFELDFGGLGYFFVYDGRKAGYERVPYFVKYSTVEFDTFAMPNKAMRQVLVWRNPSNATIVDIAKTVFWDHLWPKYGCLASDSHQTTDGQRFWSSTVGSALQKGLRVRIINTNDCTFEDITNADDFDKAIPGTWGTTKWFQRMIVVIYEKSK